MNTDTKNVFAPNCSLNMDSHDFVKLGHGSGGTMSAHLLENVFLKTLANPLLNQLEDATVLEIVSDKIAVTIDSYVVSPIFFPGGNIGSLAIHGTINDLAMRGAKPLYIAGSFILEEGLPIDDLKTIIISMQQACDQAKIKFIAGDTKVVNKGAADKIFITTCGIGLIENTFIPSVSKARLGDKVIVSGDIGLHGVAVMCARESFDLETTIESDSAPLNELVDAVLAIHPEIHCLRDITRGGLATVLNEIVSASNVAVEIDESKIPINPEVAAVCAILGLDPLYVACEGRLIAIVPQEQAELVLDIMRKHALGTNAQIIGEVNEATKQRVILKSKIGSKRFLDKLANEQLPRIC